MSHVVLAAYAVVIVGAYTVALIALRRPRRRHTTRRTR